MEILFLSTELAPFVKVGGLADVVAALPKALRALGHRVTILLPRFPAFEQGLMFARRLTPLTFSLGDRTFEVTVFDGRLPSQIDIVLVDVPGLYDRPGVYGERGEDYADNALRFAVLSRAAAEIAAQRARSGVPFDIVHAHDWATGLVSAYLPELLPEGAKTRSVFTIHNVAHQGVFPKETVPQLGFDWGRFTVDGLEFYGKANLLKQAILSADVVTTVSATYAQELVTEGQGYQLEGVIRSRAPITGIVNGVDYAVWNPATDTAIAARYDAEDASNRARCRGALLHELGFSVDTTGGIVAFVGRLVPQKGVDLLLEAIPRLLRATEAVVVIAGDGDDATAARITQQAERSHGRVVFVRAASEPLVHRIFAGADIVTVPSRYEPCGLVQLYAQRYGAVPVVRATGGLVDTVVDCDAALETGTGFVFEEPTGEALLGAIERALAAREMEEWPRLVRRIMRLDRGWERPARRYEQVYRALSPAGAAGAT
ncbi:glycogen synthase GlgA [Pendulispora rubella]|uniref:Glycogen synthase n=1 Tax=Pendulispora rubella TaxID=2741070 RepID=A0ABZ2LH25_9BACT